MISLSQICHICSLYEQCMFQNIMPCYAFAFCPHALPMSSPLAFQQSIIPNLQTYPAMSALVVSSNTSIVTIFNRNGALMVQGVAIGSASVGVIASNGKSALSSTVLFLWFGLGAVKVWCGLRSVRVWLGCH